MSLTKRREFPAAAATLADVGLVIGGVLALLAFINFFYAYGVTGERQFTNPLYMLLYYVCPLALTGVLFASLRSTPHFRVSLLVVLVSSTSSVYALELLMEWRSSSLYASTKPVMTFLEDSYDKKADAAALSKRWGIPVDTRTPDEVIATLQAVDVDPVRIMTPANTMFVTQPNGSVTSALTIDGQEVMPLAAASHRVTLLCNESGQWIDYRSDRHGFNNPDEVWQLDQLEIAALGDSFTHGYCVPPAKNFVALIRHDYPATLNLGVAGDGPLLMLATLQEYLPRFMPKVVLWFYFEGNDLTDLQTERKSALLRSYLNDGFTQKGLARQSDIDRAIVDEVPRLRALEETNRARRRNNKVTSDVMNVMRLSMLRERLGMIGGVDDEEKAAAQGPNMDAFRDILLHARNRVDAWGGQLVFVYLPDWNRYANPSSQESLKRSDVLTMVSNLGISIVDIHPAFQAHGDPLSLFPFRRAGHYNEMGHRLVADELLKALSSKIVKK